MAELFNGTVETTPAGDERFCYGKPGVAGSKNISFANLRNAILGGAPATGQIVNADLDSGDNYSVTIAHTNNTLFVNATLFDGNGIEQETSGVFQVIDSSNVKFTFNGTITGTWRYILIFA